jgi:hypothetical protein
VNNKNKKKNVNDKNWEYDTNNNDTNNNDTNNNDTNNLKNNNSYLSNIWLAIAVCAKGLLERYSL